MLSLSDLPAMNATLNGTSAILLSLGYYFIRQRAISAHKRCMLGAFVASTLFLISYLVYHYHVGSVRFTGSGGIRTVYFAILISHTILAAVIVPLVLITLSRAWKARFEKHKRIARWTLPLWLYVSVTGVVIYWMLYQR
jgi:putative membrane protein